MSLPYYQMYPKDFDANENVRVMGDAELGMYIRCLNQAWVNDGLPADPELIRRALKYSPSDFAERWPWVEPCFPVAEDGRRRNKRQEQERGVALRKVARTEAANDSRLRGRLRDENVDVKKQKRGTRAYESDSVSEVCSSQEETTPEVSPSRTALAVVETGPSPLEILEEAKTLYEQAGLPIPERQEQQIIQQIISIEPHKRGRIINAVKYNFFSGRWRNPSKTKAFLAFLADGGWDFAVTPEMLARARAPDRQESAQSAAVTGAMEIMRRRRAEREATRN